jgi:hypothetical protein
MLGQPGLPLSTRLDLVTIDYWLRLVAFKEFVRLRYFSFLGKRR